MEKVLIDTMILYHSRCEYTEPADWVSVYATQGTGVTNLEILINGIHYYLPYAGSLQIKELPRGMKLDLSNTGTLVRDKKHTKRIWRLIHNQ